MQLFKQLPEALHPKYVLNGWRSVEGMVARDIAVPISIRDNWEKIDIRQPTLIQRGKINRPLNKFKDLSLTSAVSLHYMGIEVLKDNALTMSLLCMNAQLFNCRVIVVPSITKLFKGQACSLRLYGSFDTQEQEETYLSYLKSMYAGELPLKEWPAFNAESTTADFWWDVDNGIMFSFDRNFMADLPGIVQASINLIATE